MEGLAKESLTATDRHFGGSLAIRERDSRLLESPVLADAGLALLKKLGLSLSELPKVVESPAFGPGQNGGCPDTR